jgi:heme exporter protein B
MSTKASLSRAFYALLRRDLLLAMRRRSEIANPLLFFVLVATMVPLGVGSEMKLISQMAPGVIWVSALLAAVLSLDGIFRSDFEDGTLEQLLLSAHPLSVLVLAKVSAHWLVTGLPLIVISPVLAVMLGLPEQATGVLLATLALGTPVLSLIGAIAVGLTVGLRRGGVLISLIVLPLYVPVLIFGSSAVAAAAGGLPYVGQLWLLAAFLVMALALAPLPTAAALRVSMG